jgi:hypothetical protein
MNWLLVERGGKSYSSNYKGIGNLDAMSASVEERRQKPPFLPAPTNASMASKIAQEGIRRRQENICKFL